MKDILLISPQAKGLEEPLSYPPLGLLYVASNLDRTYWKPRVKVMLDDTLTYDDLDYEYYGISVHSVGVYKEVENVIKRLTSNNPDVKIIVGGSAVGMVADRKNLYKVHGEFESFMGITDIDEIKYPARHLVPFENIHYTGKVHHSNKPSTTMIATRGCVYNCSFCDRVTLGRKFRKRSIYNVMDEVNDLKLDYEIEHIRFIDDCLTLDNKWLMQFCAMMKDMNVTWTCLSRADLLDIKTLKAMKKAGCVEIFFGFESGNQDLLDKMNKRIKVEDNEKAIKLCKEVGITSCAYMMFGFPGENAKTVGDTIEFLERCKPDKSRISTFVPIPGTDVWENPGKYDVKIKDNHEDYWYFDKKDFGLKYNYISQKEMSKLRNAVMKYYDNNFNESWTKGARQ